MAQGKIKKSNNIRVAHMQRKKERKKIRNNKHHLSKIINENIPQKKRGETNDPGLLAKIHEKQTIQEVTKKIGQHQKKVYSSIEAKILERAKKSKETFDIL